MKKYLLDTNIISELVKPIPAPNVLTWLELQKESTLFLCSVTIGELMKGITALGECSKKERLMLWLETEVTRRFQERILPYDEKAAMLWGEWNGKGKLIGKNYSILDSQIAAIAVRFGCTLVTRNTKDIDGLPVEIFNPWKS
jgi:predicted nucleic acid-binding protein